MKFDFRWLCLILFAVMQIFFAVCASAAAAPSSLRVVTTTTDLAWIVRQVGGELVSVQSLLKSSDDPHFAEIRPDYVTRLIQADVVCSIGFGLEIGWLEKVTKKSGKKDLQRGGAGHCEFARKVEPLDRHDGPVDRSMGDVHPEGNPHYWLAPVVFAKAASEAVDVLSALRPQSKQIFAENHAALLRRMNELEEQLRQKLRSANVTGGAARFFEYHKEFAYFSRALNMQSAGSIEEKPGLSPSASRLADVARKSAADNIRIILAATTAPRGVIKKFEELSARKVRRVSVSIARPDEAQAYDKLLNAIVDEIIEAHRQQN
ncbi:MAG: hypothetical protein RLZZ488_1456 [Pseudomonadota bacterium]|jgi:zinc/manganese transport system substrate-binding protein